MPMPNWKAGPLSKCCCCSLRTGTIVISLGHAIYMTIIFIICLASYVQAKKGFKEATTTNRPSDPNEAKVAEMVTNFVEGGLTPLIVMILVIIFLEALFGVLVLVGVVKKSPIWMKPWIVYNAHQWITLAIFAHFILAIMWGMVSWAAGLGSYVGMAVILLIQGYCVLVVYSYNNQLERQGFEQEELGRLKTVA